MRMLLATALLLISAVVSAAPATLPDLLDMPAEADARTLRGLILDIAEAGGRLVAVGEYGAILYSDDQGGSWRQALVPVQVTLTAVHFPTSNKGWAVGHDAVILHSDDAGESWQRQLDGRETGVILLESAEAWVTRLDQQAASAAPSGDEFVMQQDAAMMALDEALRELEIGPNRPFLDVFFLDERNGFAVGAFNYFFVTEDGGQSWRDGSPRLPNPEILHLYNLELQSDGSLILVGEFGLVLRSKNAGKDWETLYLGYEGTLFQVSSAAGRTWVAGLRGNIFYSDDNGDSWQHLKLEFQNSWLAAKALPDRRAVFAGLAGALLQVGESGGEESIHFSRVAQGHLAAVYPTADGGTVLAGQGGLIRLQADGSSGSTQYVEFERP